MDERLYEERAATEATAVRNARGKAEAEGFEVLRVRSEDVTLDRWAVTRSYKIWLYGNEASS